jgi:hypothetical protein
MKWRVKSASGVNTPGAFLFAPLCKAALHREHRKTGRGVSGIPSESFARLPEMFSLALSAETLGTLAAVSTGSGPNVAF